MGQVVQDAPSPPLPPFALSRSFALSLCPSKPFLSLSLSLCLSLSHSHSQSAWAAWFKTAEGVIPHPALWASNETEASADPGARPPVRPGAACTPEAVARLDAACGPRAAATAAAVARTGASSSSPLASQALFSVYTHAAPDWPGFAPGSLFAGTLIPTRIAASWGGHDLVDVTRALLRAALADPRNTRFALLSESGIPIYPAPVVWASLTQNRLSRINACPNPWNDDKRWHPAFGAGGPGVEGGTATPLGPPLPKSAWRKSSQWSVLTRAHAGLVVADKAVDPLFRAICKSQDWDETLKRRYDCYSDEHYIPTLLASAGRDNETDCLGYYVNVDWTKGGAHPRTYVVADVAPALFGSLREAWGDCDPAAATALGRALFGSPKAILGPRGDADGCSAAPAAWSGHLLPRECPLFARKFPSETAPAVAAALTDCGAGVIPGESGCVVGGWDAYQAGVAEEEKAEGGKEEEAEG